MHAFAPGVWCALPVGRHLRTARFQCGSRDVEIGDAPLALNGWERDRRQGTCLLRDVQSDAGH